LAPLGHRALLGLLELLGQREAPARLDLKAPPALPLPFPAPPGHKAQPEPGELAPLERLAQQAKKAILVLLAQQDLSGLLAVLALRVNPAQPEKSAPLDYKELLAIRAAQSALQGLKEILASPGQQESRVSLAPPENRVYKGLRVNKGQRVNRAQLVAQDLRGLPGQQENKDQQERRGQQGLPE
jgi:hypothetical protein